MDTEVDRTAAMETLERSIGRLFALARSYGRDAAAEFGGDLQPAGWSVLRHVVWNAPVQAGAIGEALGIDKSAVSRQLRALRALGLVSTRHSAEDARILLVEPTEAALRTSREVGERARAAYAAALEDWPDDDLAQLAALLDRFTATASRHRRTPEHTGRPSAVPVTETEDVGRPAG